MSTKIELDFWSIPCGHEEMRHPLLCKTIEHIVRKFGPIEGRTRLVKLVYLSDLEWYRRTGHTYTEASYYRYNHGPFAKEILAAVDEMDGREIVVRSEPFNDGLTYRYESGTVSRLGGIVLDAGFVTTVDRVANEWAKRPITHLLNFVYADQGFKSRDFGDPLLQ